jgi:hypothetical protein
LPSAGEGYLSLSADRIDDFDIDDYWFVHQRMVDGAESPSPMYGVRCEREDEESRSANTSYPEHGMRIACYWKRGRGLNGGRHLDGAFVMSFQDLDAFDAVYTLAVRNGLSLTSCDTRGCVTRDVTLMQRRPRRSSGKYPHHPVGRPPIYDEVWTEFRRGTQYMVAAKTVDECSWPVEAGSWERMTGSARGVSASRKTSRE